MEVERADGLSEMSVTSQQSLKQISGIVIFTCVPVRKEGTERTCLETSVNYTAVTTKQAPAVPKFPNLHISVLHLYGELVKEGKYV